MCVNVDEGTLEGRCVGFCDGEDNNAICPDPTTTCILGNDGWVSLCMTTCDPLLQDCGAGENCVGSWGTETFFCASQGLPYEDAEQVRVAACEQGRVAVPAELRADCDGSEPCCVDFCDLTEPDCDEGLICEPFVPEGSTLGVFDVGACISP